jgi:hypothetical protein
LVEDGGGRYALRYWVGAPHLEAVFAEIHRRLDHIRARGVPVPRVIAAGHVGPAYVELSEYVDGAPPQDSDAHLIDGVLAVLRSMRHAALEDGTAWGRWLLASIDDDARNFFRPSKLRAVGGEAAAILSAAQEIMGRFAAGDLVARDIVHGDFGLGNVLARWRHRRRGRLVRLPRRVRVFRCHRTLVGARRRRRRPVRPGARPPQTRLVAAGGAGDLHGALRGPECRVGAWDRSAGRRICTRVERARHR